jgi:ADP-ribose pyrophosphatase YjhB (NUDIX family)
MHREIKHCTQCGTPTQHLVPAGDNRVRAICPSCGHIEYDNPRIVAGCVIEHEGKIVLARRAIEPRKGYWTLPAGFMELGETVEQGAAREAYEEAGAAVQITQLYTLYSIPRIGQVYMMFRASLPDGNIAAGEESLEVSFFDEATMPWDELAFEAVRLTIERYWQESKRGQFTQLIATI